MQFRKKGNMLRLDRSCLPVCQISPLLIRPPGGGHLLPGGIRVQLRRAPFGFQGTSCGRRRRVRPPGRTSRRRLAGGCGIGRIRALFDCCIFAAVPKGPRDLSTEKGHVAAMSFLPFCLVFCPIALYHFRQDLSILLCSKKGAPCGAPIFF